MLTTESGSCRDKGRGGVDEGALCLSSLGCDLFAPRSPHWSALPPGQAQGPHPAPHPPLVPTGPHSVVNIHQDRVRHITGEVLAAQGPVGTRGGVEWMRGPCACPRWGATFVLHAVPTGSRCHQDKHKAPTLPHIRPLSLQDGDRRIPEFGRSKPSGRVTHITPFGRQHSSGPCGLPPVLGSLDPWRGHFF